MQVTQRSSPSISSSQLCNTAVDSIESSIDDASHHSLSLLESPRVGGPNDHSVVIRCDAENDTELRQKLLGPPKPPFIVSREVGRESMSETMQPTSTFKPVKLPVPVVFPKSNVLDSRLRGSRAAWENFEDVFISPALIGERSEEFQSKRRRLAKKPGDSRELVDILLDQWTVPKAA